MGTVFESGSLERFRDQARAIHMRAHRLIFTLLHTAVTAVCVVYLVMIAVRTPGSALMWPIAAGLLAAGLVGWQVHRRQHFEVGIAVLAACMVAGVSGVIFVQRGSNAAGVIYGMTTVAVVFIAGFARLGWSLGAWLALWTGSVTWGVVAGRVPNDAPNPFGAEPARLMALAVAIVMIGLASLISQRRRRALEALLENALSSTEAERDAARRLAERRASTVAELGHEIRTPMTGIVGATQLLAQQAMSPVQRQLLAIQRQSAERLLNLVTAVLDQAKAESGPASECEEPYAARVLCAEVAELFAPQAHRKGLEIVWTAAPDVPHGVVGNAMRVRQVLSNLVSNAVKFTAQGFVHVRLDVTPDGRLRYEIHDTGAGISEADSERIFQRFVSAAPAAESAHSTGLGLPLCRDFARRMGGDVTVVSLPGQGSRFTLELALVSAPADSAAIRPPEPPPPGRLWVVGASPPLAMQLRFLLGEMGIDARFVDTPPAEAEWAAAGAPAQAVMIDIWLGHGRAIDALPALLAQAQTGERRVIVVSSVAQDAALGAVDAVWQLFRPPRWTALAEALAWAFEGAVEVPERRPWPDGGPRVMLVDDNAVNQIVGKAMLDGLAAEVVLVDGGQAAIDAARDRTFDLILMDLQMPAMDGLEATRRLRHDETALGRARTPVVAVTGQDGGDVLAACRAAGIDALLLKPYTSAQLREIVRVHCPAGASSIDRARSGHLS